MKKKKEIAKIMAEKCGINLGLSEEMITAVFETVGSILDAGEDVYIFGFGIFKHDVHKAKRLRHPKTGEMMTIPEKTVLNFRRSINKKADEEDGDNNEVEDE